MIRKKAQVWIETVIYTLMGLAIIGILISIVTPKVNQMIDGSVIAQSVATLNKIDEQISDVVITPGNTRQVNLFFKKGEYMIDGTNSTIYYILRNTNLLYSQINTTVKSGEVRILTLQNKDSYTVFASINYPKLNITYENKNINKTLTVAPAGYGLILENRGLIGNLTHLNIRSSV